MFGESAIATIDFLAVFVAQGKAHAVIIGTAVFSEVLLGQLKSISSGFGDGGDGGKPFPARGCAIGRATEL